MCFPLPYAYSTTPAIFRLKVLYKLNLEGTLHSRVKDFTTDNTIIIIFFQILREDLYVNAHYDATILFKTTVLVIVVLSFLEFDFNGLLIIYLLMHVLTLNQTQLSTFNFLLFQFEVSDLHTLWLCELCSLATHATTEVMPFNQWHSQS